MLASLAPWIGACDGDPPIDPALQDVRELFAASCSGATCHIGFVAQPAGDLDLRPEVDCAQLVGAPAVEAPDRIRVEPGDPDASYLVCKLSPDCADRPPGATLMPLGLSDGLPADQIERVSRWIERGAPGCPGPDTQAPTFAGVSAATPLPSAIRLAWDPASDDVTAAGDIVYVVYQADSPAGQEFGQPTIESQPGATGVTMGGLPISTTYYFVVRARDAAGNVDDNRVEVSATTPDVADETPPEFAGVESAVAAGSSGVELTWQPASDDVTPPDGVRYRVYVALAPGGQDFGTPDAETRPGAITAVISGLQPDTAYHVVVRAVDGAGNQDSNTVEFAVTTAQAIGFAAQVEPILVANCTQMACHGAPMPAQGLDLRAGSAYGALVGVASTQCGDRDLVTPFDPDASYLIGKLAGVDLCAGTQMPKNGTLPAGDVQTITDWIAEGAQDN